MVISIEPRGRSNFNDLATLRIHHSKGSLETPNRVVNRHDLNAKDNIGADIALTRHSKSFIIQEIINPENLELILNKNGYLGHMLSKYKLYTNRVDNSRSLVFLYPSLTADSFPILRNNNKKTFDFIRFFSELSIQLGLDSVLLPLVNEFDQVLSFTKNRNLQLIPVLDLKAETQILVKQFTACRAAGSQDVPLIAFRFSKYTSANKGYDLIMDNLDKIHEDGQATLLVDVQRFLQPADCLSVSAPHYGAFIMADIVAEKYSGQIVRKQSAKKGPVRLFCRNDLVTPAIESSLSVNNKFDLESEMNVFSHENKLQELLQRVVENNTSENDWKHNRPMYLSRVHENVRTREEFQEFQEHIDSGTTTDYLHDKNDMNSVVSNHLRDRLSTSPISQ